MAEWNHLPADLLHTISTHLESSIDTVRFRSVCSTWRSAASARPDALYNPFPDLSQDGFSAELGGFFLSKRTIFHLSYPRSSNPSSHSDPNSPHRTPDSPSWLIKTEPGRTGFLRLFNPMFRSHIKPLPAGIPNLIDLSNIRVRELGQEYALQYANHTLGGHYSNLYMEKVACLPESDRDYVVLTVHISGKLAVYKSAGRKWSVISDPKSLYDDVIMFEGKFYAVEGSGRAVMVEAPGTQNMVVSQVAAPVDGGDRKFLVKLGRDLLLVDIHLGFPAEDDDNASGIEDGDLDDQNDGYMMMRPIRLRVFKLDKGGQGWVEVRSLGDHVLFLGDNCSFSARASELSGCKGNCICFNLGEYRFQYPSNPELGDVFRCGDIGVFSLEDGKIEPFETYPSYSKLFWPPPSWVAPASP